MVALVLSFRALVTIGGAGHNDAVGRHLQGYAKDKSAVRCVDRTDGHSGSMRCGAPETGGIPILALLVSRLVNSM